MSLARRQKRKQEQDVKKMYDKQMRLMSTMTDQQRITHLAHLQSRITPMQPNNMIEVLQPVDVDTLK